MTYRWGMTGPGFVVLYRWRLKPGLEQSFVDGWSSVTQSLLARGSRGSRLHHGSDDIWYAYAQWPSADARRTAFDEPLDDAQAETRMDDAVAEHFPPVILEVAADYWV
jgi:hypothetical protein